MRAAILALALFACGREPSFDERFSEAENAVAERARELEQELDAPDAKSGSGEQPRSGE